MRCVLLIQDIGHYHDARYRALASLGVKCTVVALHNEAGFTEFMAPEFGAYPVRKLFESRSDYRRACLEKRVWPTLQSTLSELDPSVVVVAGWAMPESFAAIAWARKHRRRLVMLSESQASDASRSVWREGIKRRIVGLSDAALVGGPPHRDYIIELGLPSDAVFTGYDAVDNTYFAAGAQAAREDATATRSRLGMPERYFIASARFVAKKNLQRLVSAYAEAVEDREDTPDLVILGDGPDRVTVENAIVVAGVEGRIHLPGFRGYSDLPAIYGLSEGCIHVSTSEQWGLVINEAAASGVPVVASSACGATCTLITDGETGFVVDAESRVSIRDGLRRLLNLDTESWAAMARAAERRVADWGPERFANGLMSACHAAEARPERGLAPWDEALLRILAGRAINAVP